MALSINNHATRYSSYDSRSSTTSSHFSNPSSSSEFKSSTSSFSRAIVKSKPSHVAQPKSSVTNQTNLTTMVQKFMGKKSSTKPGNKLLIPNDLVAEDLKKTARKATAPNFGGLHRKLFGKEKKDQKVNNVKALTEVKGNTRTLAMVLRSERELLSANKDQELEIARLKSLLEDKNNEVEKLKDLCLRQREEIKSLKNAILFPDETNSQLPKFLENQGSELKQAKQLIPTLQKQVTSLTGQLQCLAEDLAEVKADKYATRSCLQHCGSSPRTPIHSHVAADNSWEISSDDPTTPNSPDDVFLEDLNPCLTPYYAKTKSKEFEAMGFDSLDEESISREVANAL